MKAPQNAADTGTSAASLFGVSRRAEQLLSDVLVSEAMDGVFTSEKSGEEASLLWGQRVDRGNGSPFVTRTLADLLNALLSGPGVGDDGKGIEVSRVRREGNLSVSEEIGHSLPHRQPGAHSASVSLAASENAELSRLVDHGLDTKNDPELVVRLDPVLFHPVLHPVAGNPALAVREDFAREGGMELSAQEAQDVLRSHVNRGVSKKLLEERLQGRGTLEDDIGRELALIDNPVVLEVPQDIAEEWIDDVGDAPERSDPVLSVEKGVSELLGAAEIVDRDEGVVTLTMGDAGLVELLRQPVVAVDVDLDLEGKPGLDAEVDEAEAGKDVVEVDEEALPPGALELRSALAVGDLKRSTRLNGGEDADEAVGDLVPTSDDAGEILFTGVASEIAVRPADLSGDGLGVRLDALGLARREVLEVGDSKALGAEEALDAFRIAQVVQVALENDPVGAGEDAHYLVPMTRDKLVHGSLPPVRRHKKPPILSESWRRTAERRGADADPVRRRGERGR